MHALKLKILSLFSLIWSKLKTKQKKKWKILSFFRESNKKSYLGHFVVYLLTLTLTFDADGETWFVSVCLHGNILQWKHKKTISNKYFTIKLTQSRVIKSLFCRRSIFNLRFTEPDNFSLVFWRSKISSDFNDIHILCLLLFSASLCVQTNKRQSFKIEKSFKLLSRGSRNKEWSATVFFPFQLESHFVDVFKLPKAHYIQLLRIPIFMEISQFERK